MLRCFVTETSGTEGTLRKIFKLRRKILDLGVILIMLEL
jgi:hypothetical protein